MIKIDKKNLILSYKCLYLKRKYSISDAILLFKNIKFFFHKNTISISIKMNENKTFGCYIIKNHNKLNIKSDKFGLINMYICDLYNNDINELINSYIEQIKFYISQNNLKLSIKTVYLHLNMVFSILIKI